MTSNTVKWADLTKAQQDRLVQISRGAQSIADSTWIQLANLGLVSTAFQRLKRDVDFVTPLGGQLLNERDALMVNVILQVMVTMQGGRIREKDLFELLEAAKACSNAIGIEP